MGVIIVEILVAAHAMYLKLSLPRSGTEFDQFWTVYQSVLVYCEGVSTKLSLSERQDT